MVNQMLDKSRIDLFRAFINGMFLKDFSSLIMPKDFSSLIMPKDFSSLITFSGLNN